MKQTRLRFRIAVARLVWAALPLIVSGCGMEATPGGAGPGAGAASESGPFGPPSNSRLLSPFAGAWRFDLEKTLAAQKDGGAGEEELASIRKLYADNPQLGAMHADLTITGNEAVGADGCEYRLFAMHEHDGIICGKAWHHEDRFDPGDMSKCYVRLKTKDNLLYLEVKMKDGLPDLNDPDLVSESPPAEGGSPASCDAESPSGNDWSGWTTYVFTRKQ